MSDDLLIACRELNTKSCYPEIRFRMPLMEKMKERNNIIKGGLRTIDNAEIADTDDQVQEYGPEEGLNAGDKDILGQFKANVAQLQHPLERSSEERKFNGPDSDGKIVPLAERKYKAAIRGMRIRLAKRIYGCASDAEKGLRHTFCQGVGSALYPLNTYLYVDRTDSAKAWFQPRAFANTTTSYNISKSFLRTLINQAQYYAEEPDGIFIVMGTTLYEALTDEFEMSTSYNADGAKYTKASHGFRSLSLDDVDILEDPFLDTITTTTVAHNDGTAAGLLGDLSSCGASMGGNLASYNGTNCVFVLNADSWQFRYLPKPAPEGSGNVDDMMEITDFFNQSNIAGGQDKDLAHLMMDGNLICTQPNTNIARVNVH